MSQFDSNFNVILQVLFAMFMSIAGIDYALPGINALSESKGAATVLWHILGLVSQEKHLN